MDTQNPSHLIGKGPTLSKVLVDAHRQKMLGFRPRRSLLSTRLHPLRLKARLLGSTPTDGNRDADDDQLPRITVKEREYLESNFHLLPAGVKAFRARAGHFIVPYALVLPHPQDMVVNGQVVSPQEIVQGNPVNNSGVVYGRVKDVREIEWPAMDEGFMFGMCLRHLLTTSKHHIKYAWVMQELRDMGFPVDKDWIRHYWSEQVLAPLKVYYAIKGDTLVPDDFVVPRGNPRWPVAAWGLPLGMRVGSLRVCHERGGLSRWKYDNLSSVDFVFNVSDEQWQAVVLPALRTFSQVRGHCNVGSNFVVPAEAPWPRRCWGCRLGEAVNRIRSKGDFAAQVARDAAQLEEIGFVWNHYDHEWNERVLPALQAFAQVEGHCNVPQSFMVPSVHPYPENAGGIPLGTIVQNMRSHGTYKLQSDRDAALLEEIGFVWNCSDYEWRERILPALQAFAQVEGHCNVPQSFIVPSVHPYPEKAWSMPLGSIVRDMRSHKTYKLQNDRDAALLQDIGFVWNARQYRWDTVVLPAFQVYFQVYGDCRVPFDFTVPSEAPWPEQAWGINLGQTLYIIIYRGAFKAQRLQDREALESIRFGEKKSKPPK